MVDNSLKYSPGQKEIQIELLSEKNSTVLTIQDNGCGISDSDKEKIFNKFFRAGNEETRNTKGTGLGLYIVNYIVHHYGAPLLVKNNLPKGTIFEIRFNAV